MTVRQRILEAMFDGTPDQVPLTIYEFLFPRGIHERTMRELGLGLVMRPPAHTVEHRNVEIISKEYWESGRKLIRKTIHTPIGDIWQTLEPDVKAYGDSNWIQAHFIKDADDYRIMEYYINDAAYHKNYQYLDEEIRRIGDDGLVYVRISKSPIQEMLYQMMGMERFSFDYYDRRDLFDSLHETVLKRYRELFTMACDSPVEILLLADNITSDVVGTERYRAYLMPVYQELNRMMAGTGKKLGVHMDGNIASLAQDVALSDFDIMEALTPPPMGDFSIRDARTMWHDKSLWINFTSSVHIESEDRIRAHTRDLLDQAGTSKGFAVGITENAPIHALEKSLPIIAEVLREYGAY